MPAARRKLRLWLMKRIKQSARDRNDGASGSPLGKVVDQPASHVSSSAESDEPMESRTNVNAHILAPTALLEGDVAYAGR